MNCPECNTELKVPEDAMKGEIVDCPDCGVELEVVNPESKELKVAQIEGEDWGQ